MRLIHHDGVVISRNKIIPLWPVHSYGYRQPHGPDRGRSDPHDSWISYLLCLSVSKSHYHPLAPAFRALLLFPLPAVLRSRPPQNLARPHLPIGCSDRSVVCMWQSQDIQVRWHSLRLVVQTWVRELWVWGWAVRNHPLLYYLLQFTPKNRNPNSEFWDTYLLIPEYLPSRIEDCDSNWLD